MSAMPTRRSTAPACCVALVVALAAGDGFAQPDEPVRFAVVWKAPAECAREAQVRSLVERRLNRAQTSSPELTVSGQVTKTDDGYVADLLLMGPQGDPLGTRQVHSTGTSCDALDVPASVVAAMMLNVQRRDLDIFVASSRPTAPPPPPPAPPIVDEPAAPPAEPRAWAPMLSVSASSWFGASPRAAFGATVAVGAVYRKAWMFGVEPTAWIGMPLPLEGGRQVDFRGLAGSVFLGWRAHAAGFTVGPRILVLGGVTWSEASGFDVNHSSVAPFAAAGAGLTFAKVLGSFSIFACADALAALVWSDLSVLSADGTSTVVYTASRAIVRFSLGVGWDGK